METKLYKIGQLARLSHISPRTIDYYTKLGLIEPEKRSTANYRLYSSETLSRLKRIEAMKREKYTLEEIKDNLQKWNKVSHEEDIADKLSELQVHLQQLEKEVKALDPMFEHLKPYQAKNAFKLLSPHGVACIEAILLLLAKSQIL